MLEMPYLQVKQNMLMAYSYYLTSLKALYLTIKLIDDQFNQSL